MSANSSSSTTRGFTTHDLNHTHQIVLSTRRDCERNRHREPPFDSTLYVGSFMSTGSPASHAPRTRVGIVPQPIRRTRTSIDVGMEGQDGACCSAIRNLSCAVAHMSTTRVPRAHIAAKVNKSCQRCSLRKRKCDGNGFDPCRREAFPSLPNITSISRHQKHLLSFS